MTLHPLRFLAPVAIIFAATPLFGSAGAAEASPAPAQPATLDLFVSTGDNHFLGSSLPIDSPGSIEATFDLFKNVNHARRIYWRGLEEATWVSSMAARPANCRYNSLWTWMQWLYANVKPDELAVKAARARGLEIWGVGTMFDWGSPADTPTFNDYPFPFESKLKLEHPEWACQDQHGGRRQGGPIELAYPEARRALVDLHLSEALKAGYDGITFLTYAENYSLRFQDEFGYSNPIVRDFKKLHGIDLRTEPFRRGATREDWLRLRGGYVTAYLRELRAALQPHGKKLGVILNGNDIHFPQPWNVPEMISTAGSQWMDVETWVREGLVDNLVVYGNCSPSAQRQALDDLLFLCRETGVEVSFMTSSPLAKAWAPYYERGARGVMAVSDDAQHLDRGFIPEQTVGALGGSDLWPRMRALQQVVDGQLSATFEQISPLAKSPHLIERRLALEALGKLGEAAAARTAPILEAALDDEENGVRCAAALSLSRVRRPESAPALLRSLEAHGNHMLAECVVIALRQLKPFPAAVLLDAVRQSKNGTVRMAAMRAIEVQPTVDELPVLRAALLDPDRFTAMAAAEAMGNLRKTNAAVLPLVDALANSEPAVAARAAVSLGVIAARREPEVDSLRGRMLAALQLDFERFGAGCTREDSDWGYRPVGNALRAFGVEGESILRTLRDQRYDLKLAELAWRVLDLHQKPGSFSEVTVQQNEEAYSHRPPATLDPTADAAKPPQPGRELHVNPATGNDANDGIGRPFKTIARAVRLAEAGDTIHLAPTTYYESIDLTLKHGEMGRPITVDGHGAVIEGSEPVSKAEWEQVSAGLYRKQHLIPRIDDAIIQRWFMLWNGKMNHMGRTSKGIRAPFKKPEDLQADEWTYVAAEDSFYVKLAPDQDLDAAKIRYPRRSAGVIESISGSHLLVRNITSAHVYNDGCNIHGMTRDCRFENITSLECGDDGFSAHEDCQCEIDGFVSIGNSTGLADVGSSHTHYRHVIIRDCLGVDVLVMGDGDHSIEDGVITSTAHSPLTLDGQTGRDGHSGALRLKNVRFERAGAPAEISVGKGMRFSADHCTFLAASLRTDGEMTLRSCIYGGNPKPSIVLKPNAKWLGEGNLYDLAGLRVMRSLPGAHPAQPDLSFTAATFAEFQKETDSEKGSEWKELPSALPPEIGAPMKVGEK